MPGPLSDGCPLYDPFAFTMAAPPVEAEEHAPQKPDETVEIEMAK